MQLRHPNVVRCWGVVAAEPMLGIVLEYCAGGDVRHAAQGGRPEERVRMNSLRMSSFMIKARAPGADAAARCRSV